MDATSKDLLMLSVLLSLFLRTRSGISARIPLPSSKPPVLVAFESTFPPGEGFGESQGSPRNT